MHPRSFALGSAGVIAFVAVVHVGAQAPAGRDAQSRAGAPVSSLTYTKDVAPIMQRSCQTCHRPGTNAPMSLTTYEDVRPWARSIKAKVQARLMPPWHIERNVGIQQFKDDPSLSDAEIATIVSWVDAGAPRGTTAEPPAPTFPDDETWTIGEPDVIVEIPKPHIVAASGPDLWIDYIADSGLTEDRYLQAVEAKPGPGARAVVHHLLTYLIQDVDEGEVLAGRLDDRPTNNESFLNEFAVGKNGDILPEGTGKLVKAGSKIRFNLHYHPSGTTTTDRARVGLKFYPKGYKPKYHQISLQIANAHEELDIPPNTWTRHDGYYRFSKPARVTAIQAHMHNRGKRMCVEAILPSGRAETLNCMYFDFNWHKVYNYADEVTPILPAGTMLHTILWHDNTSNNRSNPDPRNWVGYGQRTIDEMAFSWVTWTYLDDADYESLLADQTKQRTSARER